ncbi:MAG: hypothetical protein ACI8W3_001362, partial [Myxococcota bacterium]
SICGLASTSRGKTRISPRKTVPQARFEFRLNRARFHLGVALRPVAGSRQTETLSFDQRS